MSMELFRSGPVTYVQIEFYKNGRFYNNINVMGTTSKTYSFVPDSEDLTLKIRACACGSSTVTVYVKDY